MSTPEENLSPVQEGQEANPTEKPTEVYGPETSEQLPAPGDTVVEAQPQNPTDEQIPENTPNTSPSGDEFSDPWKQWAEESVRLAPSSPGDVLGAADEEEFANTPPPLPENTPEDASSSVGQRENASDSTTGEHATQEQTQEQTQDQQGQDQQLAATAPSTTLEAQPNDEAVPTESTSVKKRKKLLGYGGLAAGVAGVAAAAAIAFGGSASEPSDAEATPPEEEVDQNLADREQDMLDRTDQPPLDKEDRPSSTEETDDIVIDDTEADSPEDHSGPISESQYPSLRSPEVINQENEPVLMTADNPEELLYQYLQNRSCILNSHNFHIESTCLEAMFGNTPGAERTIENARRLIQTNTEYTRGHREGRAERGEEPYFIKHGWEIVDAWQSDENHMSIQVKMNLDWSPINHPDNDTAFIHVLEFEKTTTSAENMSSFAPDQEIWIKRGDEQNLGTESL